MSKLDLTSTLTGSSSDVVTALREGDTGLSTEHQATFDLYDRVAAVMEKRLGRKVTSRLVTQVVNVVLTDVVFQAMFYGQFKFPSKLGMLRLERLRPTWMKVDGVKTQRPAQAVLRFVEGDAVLAALGRRRQIDRKTLMNRTTAFPAEQAASVAAQTAEELRMLAGDLASMLEEEGNPSV